MTAQLPSSSTVPAPTQAAAERHRRVTRSQITRGLGSGSDIRRSPVDDCERGSPENAEILQRVADSQLVPAGETDNDRGHPQERHDFPWLAERAQALTAGVDPIANALAKVDQMPQ